MAKEPMLKFVSVDRDMPEKRPPDLPQDRLCEGNCVIEQSGHGTVTIGSVEKYITDTAWENGWVKPASPSYERSESVGIIGAGPGGLAAADRLRRAGVQVTVYDRYDRAGGLMTYGIPGFKLEKDVVMKRIDQLEQGGVSFELNCNVGEDISFAQLQSKHDAVLIATGVYKSRDLPAPGSDATGRQSPEVIEGADYVEDADLVIKALGFEPEDLVALWDVPELAVTRWGTVKADFHTHETNLPGVYACGDIQRGASLVVWAIRDGREAADAIIEQIKAAAPVAAE